MLYEGYNSASQTISELSAIDAPTRQLWFLLALVYCLLLAAFGWGIRQSAGQNRPLRIVGGLMIAYGIIGLFWPPMHQREVLAAGGGTISDTLHIVMTFVWGLFSTVSIAFGAAALGKRFRLYSITTIVILLVFGILTGTESPGIEANGPTPLIGVWERIGIGSYLLWVAVLAIVLLKAEKKAGKLNAGAKVNATETLRGNEREPNVKQTV